MASRAGMVYFSIVEETGDRAASESEGRSYGAWRWLVVVAVLLVIYPLSSGPVLKLEQEGLVPPGVWSLYLPLWIFHDKSTVGKRCVEWYLEDVWKIGDL